MTNLLTAFLGICFVLTVLGAIPFGFWMLLSARRKRWKLVGIQAAVVLAIVAMLWGGTAYLGGRVHAEFLTEVYDTKTSLGRAVYSYESSRELNGNGYSLSVYKLPPEIRTRFEAADERLLTQFPQRPRVREDWKTQLWKQAPLDPQFQRYIDLALSSADAEKDPALKPQFDAIREALARGKTYYSSFFEDEKGQPKGIDLFVVDLESDRLYVINHNT